MYYKEDWEMSKKRMEALWHNEIVDRCCIAVSSPKEGRTYCKERPPEKHEDLAKYYTDPETVLKRSTKWFENHYFGGEAFPSIHTNFGVAGHAAYVKGCKYQYALSTIWFSPSFDNISNECIRFDPDSELLVATREFMRILAKEGQGKFYVSMPDNCGSIDALAHLRGSDNLLIDMLMEPEIVSECIGQLVGILKKTGDEQVEIIKSNNDGGSTNSWMNTWAPGRHLQLQCDLSVMISPAMYEKFVLPELEETANWLDYAIYHLDGQEQVKHLEYILSVKKINIVQWTPVDGQPPTSAFIPTLKRIQEAGKGLILMPKPNEVEFLLSELSHKGLYLKVDGVKSEEDAKALIKKAEKMAHI